MTDDDERDHEASGGTAGSSPGEATDQVSSFWHSLDRQIQSSLMSFTVADLASR
jgi:DNA-binding IscR family transcriptional regulator